MSPTTLKQRRARLGFTQQNVAQMLGVSQQTVARWESGGDIPSKYLKDLAIILVCRVSDLVGERAAARGGSKVLRVLNRAGEIEQDEDDEQVPYGTVRAGFVTRPAELAIADRDAEDDDRPLTHDYPISVREMHRLYSRLQDEDERASWFVFETLDNRLVLMNRSELESFEMIGDDVVAMPPFEHEEVYAALADYELRAILESREVPPDDDAAKYSKAFIEGCMKVVERWGGTDTMLDRITGITIETVNGRRENLFSDPSEDAYDRINSLVLALELGWPESNAPVRELLVELGTEGYYRSSFYRLGALRLIEAPLHACNAAQEALGEDAPNDETVE